MFTMYLMPSGTTVVGLSTCVYLLLTLSRPASGHGRLLDPPSRSTMWRIEGFKFLNTPPNYEDNQLFCGGAQVQWEMNGGKCGPCGDRWDGTRDNEAGGKYATGRIVKKSAPGSVLDVTVELTTNHKGWFEFRLCENNNPKKRVTHECLNKHLLQLYGTGKTRYPVHEASGNGKFRIKLQLPKEVMCTQCILQWKYNAGNSWGTDPETGEGCVGCGPQEQFYGCADISIGFEGIVSINSIPRVFPCLQEGYRWNEEHIKASDNQTQYVCGLVKSRIPVEEKQSEPSSEQTSSSDQTQISVSALTMCVIVTLIFRTISPT